MTKARSTRRYLNKRANHLLLPVIKLFSKTRRGLDFVSLHHDFLFLFCMTFDRKYFYCFVNWPNFIIWLPLLLAIMGNMCIVIIRDPVCNVINFQIKLGFLIKPFSHMIKKSQKKLNILRTTYLFFNLKKIIIFKGFSVARNCLGPESGPLKT